jgi:hypothetical protein
VAAAVEEEVVEEGKSTTVKKERVWVEGMSKVEDSRDTDEEMEMHSNRLKEKAMVQRVEFEKEKDGGEQDENENLRMKRVRVGEMDSESRF